MNLKVATAVLSLLVPILACANEERANGEASVIARVGAKEIRYRDIRCAARFAAPPDDPRCHALEQQKLDELMSAELVAAAARIHGIAVSDEEALAAAPKGAAPLDAQLRQADAHFKAMAKAVLMVHDGASADEVFARELAPKGITRAQFDSAYVRWDRDAAQKALTYDFAGEGKRKLLADYRMRLQLRRIKDLAAARASARGLSPEEASRELWREVIARTDARIIDTRYSFPNMERL